MTVKLAKFFNSVGSNTAVPPPLPPPNPIQSYYTTTMANNSGTYQHQQQQQQQHYNPYMDDDDNMSMYSTSTSIMTSRDHPYNNSQRPLLPERKPQLLNKKKLPAQTQPQQQQQQQQQPNNVGNQHYKPYISPYVQQQKRDSAKGLHGFNDFDILSQQYNQHLQSPHIGYPYGSPPSPTVNSTDFVFDDNKYNGGTATAPAVGHHQARYANINSINSNGGTGSNVNNHYGTQTAAHNNVDYYGCGGNQSNAQFIGKSSRFEDDFCTRRNMAFAKEPHQPPPTNANHNSGPFIFGISHEQQQHQLQLQQHEQEQNLRMPAGGRGFRDSSGDDTVIVAKNLIINDNSKYNNKDNGHATMQSTSDTSSSSRDSKCKTGVKALLGKRKSKKKKVQQTEKELETDAATNKSEIPTIKCVVVGDGAVGKTNLILSYLENRFNAEHVPTASDIYNADVMVNDNPVHLTLCDTAGQDTLDPLRELCYPDSDVFLLCFSVAKPDTFHAIKTKWAPKFAKTKAALILVGTQADLRNNQNVLNKLKTNGEKPISYADAWDLATTIGAKYIETSSITQEKVKDVFDTAIWEGLLPTTLPPTPSFWRKLFCLS